MSILYNKVREKFNLIKFNKLLSQGNQTEIFDAINKVTGHNPIEDERIEYGELQLFLDTLCDFKKTIEYTPFVSFVASNETVGYGENEFGLLKLKLKGDKKFKYYLSCYSRHDFEDRFIEDSYVSFNLFKDNENVDYQNCINHILVKMEGMLGKEYINIASFYNTKGLNWSEDTIKKIIKNRNIKFNYY